MPEFIDPHGARRGRRLKERLADATPLIAVELRPPRRDLEGVRAMDAWIDVYHSVVGLSAADTVVFLTDNAVGAAEEENLNHLVTNLGGDAVRERIVPFLTLKHPLDYCLWFAERARGAGFPGLVVLGGDRHDGSPRCLPHAWELRARLRKSDPGCLLGGWANPYRDAGEQVEFLLGQAEGLDFALTQVVSHYDIRPVEAFLNEAARRGLDLPIFAGAFFYRSANPRTLGTLSRYIPVPAAELESDFVARGKSAEEIAAETLRALGAIGFTRFYVSNLETGLATKRLSSIASLAGLPPPVPGPANGSRRL